MRRRTMGIPQIAGAALVLALAMPAGAAPLAQAAAKTAAAAPVHLVIAGPKTPITDALFELGKQTSMTIVADDSVKGTLSAMTIDKPDLGQALDAIAAASPGVAWQKIYLAADATLPDANTLAAQVRALNAITASHMLVANPATHANLRFARDPSDSQATSTAGMQTVYLVTNQAAPVQSAAAPAASAGKTAVEQTVAGIQDSADEFAKLTPQEQSQAVPLMFLQFQRIYQSMDPGLRAALTNQFQQDQAGPGER